MTLGHAFRADGSASALTAKRRGGSKRAKGSGVVAYSLVSQGAERRTYLVGRAVRRS
jgi:hypothetical protein